MLRLIAISIVTAVVVAFGVANAHEVYVSYVFGEPVVMRLIFLISVAFFGGIMTTVFYRMSTHARKRRRPRRMRGTADRARRRAPRLLSDDREPW